MLLQPYIEKSKYESLSRTKTNKRLTSKTLLACVDAASPSHQSVTDQLSIVLQILLNLVNDFTKDIFLF